MSKISNALLSTAAASAGVMALTFLSGVMIARLLGPELRGAYGAVMVVIQTAAALLTLSHYDAAIVCMGESKIAGQEMLSSLLSSSLVIGAVATAIFVASSMAHLLPWAGTPYVVAFASASVLVSMVAEAFQTVERSALNFRTLNTYRVLNAAAFGVCTGLLLYTSLARIPWLLAAFVASQAAFFPFWIWKFARYILRPVDLSFIVRCFGLGAKLHIAFSINVVANQIDKLLLIKAWPSEMVGNYFVAYSAVGAGYSLLSSAMSVTLFPIFASLEGPVRRQNIHRLLRCAMILTILSSLGLLLVIPILIPLVFGTKYAAAASMGIGLIAPLALMSLRVIFIEATRARGDWRPSAEMAFISLAVFTAGFALTAFAEPYLLFVTMTLAALGSLARGAQHLVYAGDISISRELLPTWSDARYLASLFLRLAVRR